MRGRVRTPRRRRRRRRAMHLHILGICGTFMGGIAAIARRPGHTRHRLRRQRLSADEHAARGAGHRADRGLRRRRSSTAWRARRHVRRRQRRVARQSADGGDPRPRPAATSPGRNGWPRTCCADKWVLAVAGTHGKTTTTAMLAWILEYAGLKPGFLIGGVPQDFGVSARLTGSAVLRHRGRRVRHRLLRQALQVRPLPAAHGDPQQPRVRPRRHLPRPGRDRDAVPPSGAHRAAATGCSSSTAARRASRACWRAAAGAGRALRPAPRCRAPVPTGRSASTARSCSAASCRARWRSGAAGRAQPLNALAAIAAARHAGVPVRASLDALAAFQGVKRRMEVRGTRRRRHRLRRLRPPPDRHRARTLAGLRAQGRRSGRASSPCWSRARTP